MDIKLFDKRYVYLEWSDELEGKDCILAKTYQDLKDFVNSGDEGRIFKINKGTEKPFTNLWSECDFCYYDPNLKVKKAWIEGKTIQKRDLLNEWEDYIDTERICLFFYNIKWDAHEWRVKPTETWYVVFVEHDFMRVSIINNEFSTVFFKGTYEECGKWINEHKKYAEIISTWIHGKLIEYYQNGVGWMTWMLDVLPSVESLESTEWRIKPTCYFVNIYKGYNDGICVISKIDDTSIFHGTEKQCEYVVKKVNEFISSNCLYKCRGTNCNNCTKLLDFVKNIEFKSVRRMTNKELAEYLAEGNGEMKIDYFSTNALKFISTVYTSYSYLEGTENEEIGSSTLIRDFGSDEWREPLIEV